MNYATLEQLKSSLKMTTTDFDNLLTFYISKNSRLIDKYCSRQFFKAERVEEYFGGSNNNLIVKHQPVLSVEYVKLDTQNITFKRVDFGAVLDRKAQDYQFLEIKYVSGFDLIPDDITQACIVLSVMDYRQKDQIGLTNRNVGQETATFDMSGMPETVKNVLNRYRAKVFNSPLTFTYTYLAPPAPPAPPSPVPPP